MSYKYNDDDVIVFDLFDDEHYKNWQEKVRQNADAEKRKNTWAESEFGPATVSENGFEIGSDYGNEIGSEFSDIEDGYLKETAEESAVESVVENVNTEPEINEAADISKISDLLKKDIEKTISEPDDTAVEQTGEKSKKSSKIRFITEILAYIAVAVIIITVVPRYVMERVSVDGNSMNNTLFDGDQLIGDKLTVRLNRLKRFDIIYFSPQGNKTIEPYIKRIIGLPGDTVKIEDSVIYINGMPLQEDYAAEPKFKAYSAADTIWLGEDEYFVLGDNRNNSTDSRFSLVGVVSRKDIEGKAVFRIWPLTSFGNID